MYIRSLFEAQKNVREPRQQKVHIAGYRDTRNGANRSHQALIEETESLLEKWKHPDPYRPPTAPGGKIESGNETGREC